MLQTGVLELFAGKAAHLLLARLMGSNVLLAGVCRLSASSAVVCKARSTCRFWQQCRSNVRLCCQKWQQCRTSFALKFCSFDKVECCFDIVAQNGNIVEATGNKVACCFDNVASTLLLVWTGLNAAGRVDDRAADTAQRDSIVTSR